MDGGNSSPGELRSRRPGRPALIGLLVGLVVIAVPFIVLRAGADGGRAARPTSPGPVVAAVGDMACDPRNPDFAGRDPRHCQQVAVSSLVLRQAPAALLALGDLQYKSGVLHAFDQSYGPSYGRLLRITDPTPGNHDFGTPHASGYFGFFGRRAGPASEGWYSFDIGSWHIISLNSECQRAGGCATGSPQEQWLRNDLATHQNVCTLAYWHEPRFSSGVHGNDNRYAAFWRDLYAARADVVLNGHDHDYERFAAQTPDAYPDPARGIREFVVGTGGESQYKFHQIRANSEVRHTGTFGALFLTLGQGGYQWVFRSAVGPAFSDSGSGHCH